MAEICTPMNVPSAILVEGRLPIVFCSDCPTFGNVAHGNNPPFLKVNVESPQEFAPLQGNILQADKFLCQDRANNAKNAYQKEKTNCIKILLFCPIVKFMFLWGTTDFSLRCEFEMVGGPLGNCTVINSDVVNNIHLISGCALFDRIPRDTLCCSQYHEQDACFLLLSCVAPIN